MLNYYIFMYMYCNKYYYQYMIPKFYEVIKNIIILPKYVNIFSLFTLLIYINDYISIFMYFDNNIIFWYELVRSSGSVQLIRILYVCYNICITKYNNLYIT